MIHGIIEKRTEWFTEVGITNYLISAKQELGYRIDCDKVNRTNSDVN